MESVPRYEAAYFLMIGSKEIVLGQYQPAWCGSDCRCGLWEDAEPMCWAVYPIVGGKVLATPVDDEPEGWKPI